QRKRSGEGPARPERTVVVSWNLQGGGDSHLHLDVSSLGQRHGARATRSPAPSTNRPTTAWASAASCCRASTSACSRSGATAKSSPPDVCGSARSFLSASLNG